MINSIRKTFSMLTRLRLVLKEKQKLPPALNIGSNTRIHPTAMFTGVLSNIKIGSNVSIGPYVSFVCHDENSSISIGDNTVIKQFAQLMTYPGGTIQIGSKSSVNPFCVLYGHGGLKIGNNVRIATHSVFIPANHKFKETSKTITEQGLHKKGIMIGDDIWFGAGTIILDGVEIQNGAVVGAGAVVNKNVEKNKVVAGVPARVIKTRGI
jgi:acetyltransferase-like isoleucine patch superfamily enzyme